MPNIQKRHFLYAAAAASAMGAGWLWRSQGQQEASPQKKQQDPDGQSGQNMEAAWWEHSLTDMQGQRQTLSAYRGRILLINFWATWCPPCVEEMPSLERFYQKNRSKNHQVLGIAVDQRQAVLRFLQQNKITYPNFIVGSEGLALGKSLGNQSAGLPFSVFVHQDGTVVKRKTGKLDEDDLTSWENRAN